MTDDQERAAPESSPQVTTEETKLPEPAPMPVDAPPAVPEVPPSLESAVDAPPPAAVSSLRERLTPFRLLVGASAVLAVIAILLGLMVFAPSVAPIKFGSARLAAEAGDVQEIEVLARRFAENFMTIDYQTLDADFERVLADTTGTFRTQIEGVLDVYGDLLVKAKSVSRGEVNGVTVLSRGGDNASVSARVSRTITNDRNPNARPTQHTLLITLIRTASAWKVADLTEVPGSVGAGDVAPR